VVSAIQTSSVVEHHPAETKRPRRARRADAKIRRSLDALRRTIDDNAEILAHLERAPKSERARIAADIRDDWMQVMGAADLRAQALVRQMQDPALRVEAAELFELVDRSIDRFRHLLLEPQR
jgi:hypothetical protein